MSEKKPRATRIYIVTERGTEKPVALIETITEAAARKWHSDKTVNVRHASQKDMVAATKEGIEIEAATAAEESE
jgi:hypothetical protein